ncbi:peptidase [Altererythrobacter halimionae]|uniref:Peptidase n=2 Tax=Alteriqipengyuania halimionae TaxID=1926630 RepID=A0A6I4U6V4_9SPHN|nr:peptidase [Alteriqipengyuania halimionae]
MDYQMIAYALLGALAIALAIAATTDFLRRKIYNWLVLAIVVLAPVWWWVAALEPWPEMAIQLGMAVATFAVGAGLFALGAMGGGDVKLISALALWFAPLIYLKFLFLTALIGGLLTILFAGFHVARRRKDKIAIPYGMAIAAAGLWTIFSTYGAFLGLTGATA